MTLFQNETTDLYSLLKLQRVFESSLCVVLVVGVVDAAALYQEEEAGVAGALVQSRYKLFLSLFYTELQCVLYSYFRIFRIVYCLKD